MTKKPIIGVVLDHLDESEYSGFEHYVLRKNYFDVITQAGGVPIALLYHPEFADTYHKMIDGLLIAGGDFDIDPAHYGEAISSDRVACKTMRTEMEISLTKQCLESKKPILGICGGEQLLNVILGGSLIQHIPDSIPDCLEHEVKPYDDIAHEVAVSENSLLHKITGKTTLGVNSSHHQAVKACGSDVVACAYAPDGVIEAIAHTKHPFCLGVQWHPEYHVTESDVAIIKAFLSAC